MPGAAMPFRVLPFFPWSQPIHLTHSRELLPASVKNKRLEITSCLAGCEHLLLRESLLYDNRVYAPAHAGWWRVAVV